MHIRVCNYVGIVMLTVAIMLLISMKRASEQAGLLHLWMHGPIKFLLDNVKSYKSYLCFPSLVHSDGIG